jgi:hypothetical protein
MLTDMVGESEYRLMNLMLKDFGSKLLYPLLQHMEVTKALRAHRKTFEKLQERYEGCLMKHSQGKDDHHLVLHLV